MNMGVADKVGELVFGKVAAMFREERWWSRVCGGGPEVRWRTRISFLLL
jgi:hypothetical protein